MSGEKELDLEADPAPAERDIEEPNAVLDAEQGDPVEFWVKKQRDLVLSVLDYNLGALADLIQSKTIDLSPRYQRRARWDPTRQSRLIESFLMNVPVPPVFLNEDQYGQYSVIDGKQRLTAINEFLRGRLQLRGLTVFADINGKSYDSLPTGLQNVLRTRANLRAVIILRQSDPDVKVEVFQRLNTGGVTLNAQEIRNSAWPGSLNDSILDLSEDHTFHRLLGIKDPNKSVIYREMRDAEFVLRYFTFRQTWSNFTGGMKRHMDRFMMTNQRMPTDEVASAGKDFLRTLQVVEAAFGDHAFRRWVPEQGHWRKQVLAALFDAEMFAAQGHSPSVMTTKRAEIDERVRALFQQDDFRKAIDAATNTPTLFQTRIRMMKGVLDAVEGV